ITLGTTNVNFEPNAGWVIFAPNPWAPSESYGFNVTYLLRANFGNAFALDLGGDQDICTGDSTVLDVGPGWTSISWNGTPGSQMLTVTTSGTYIADVMSANGCSYTDTVIVSVNATPNAGMNGNINICVTDSGLDLGTVLGGTPDMGGSWADLSGSGGLSGNIFDPNLSGSGSFNFQYNVTNNCGADSSLATVVVDPLGDPGQGGGTAALCDFDPAIDLGTLLTGTPDMGGTWSDDDNSGGLSVSNFDPNGVASGTYNFTYSVVNGVCPAATATVSVTVNLCPNIDQGLALDFRVFPNPTEGLFRIEAPNALGAIDVRVMDMLGKVVLEANGLDAAAPAQLDLSDVDAGVYFIEVNDGETVGRKQLIVH
ncbi:MAG: T9SS type A sorting domain-containing protein, partial [Bacteroidota bacterium]